MIGSSVESTLGPPRRQSACLAIGSGTRVFSGPVKLFRYATIADAASILEIYSFFVLHGSVSFETAVPTNVEMKNRIEKTSASFPWLVCEVDGEVVGYAYACRHRERAAYGWSAETTVYVRDGFQGRGIGREMYRHLIAILRRQGVCSVFAGITLPNEASEKLHRALGFEPAGRFKNIGYKNGQWWDTGWWSFQIQRPERPAPLSPPPQDYDFKEAVHFGRTIDEALTSAVSAAEVEEN